MNDDVLPDQLSFAEPAIFWMLTIILPLLFLKIATDRKAGQAAKRFASGRLRRRLVPRVGLYSWFIFTLRLAGLSLFIVALARPQLGQITEEVETEGRSILIAIDTSKSMLAPDLKPDRLTRAKLAAQDLVEGLGGDRIGLIAFAGRPFLQAPLTIDHAAVTNFLGRLDTDSAPRGGSNLAEAIKLALETFDKDEAGSHALIVFTDGDELEGSAIELAKQAKDRDVVIVTIGTGTRLGEIIPDPDPERIGEFIKDDTGKIVRTQLHPETLEAVSQITGGVYLDLGASNLSADAIEESLKKIDSRTIEATEETRRIERYKIPLAAGMICFLASFLAHLFIPNRQSPVFARGSLASMAFLIFGLSALLLSSGNLRAELKAAPPEADPKELFDNGRFQEAAEAYRRLAEEDTGARKEEGKLTQMVSKWFKRRPAPESGETSRWRYGSGAAAYKAQDYKTAQRAFSDALQAGEPEIRSRAHHGLAGTLFRRGESLQGSDRGQTIALWNEALEHYDETIKLDPENKVAPKNAAYIRHLLDNLEKQEKEQQPNPEEKKDEPQDGEGDQGEKEPDEKKEPDEGEGEGGEGDPNQEQPGEGEGEGEEKEKENEEQPDGDPKDGDPKGEEEKKEKTPAELALEAVLRYAEEDQEVDFRPRAFRQRGYKDW